MDINKNLKCPKCSGNKFSAKFETTYLYSYDIDTSTINYNSSSKKTLPFMFDNRKRYNAKQYLECKNCGESYPCDFTMNEEEFDFTIIQKAIRSEHVKEPHYWG